MARYLTPDGVAARLKDDRAVGRARRLRRTPTKSERLLWYALREIESPRFRRQLPIGPFIVDFACHAARLIVEIDGGIHEAPDIAARDGERQRWLEGRGYAVMRVTARHVLEDRPAVMRAILATVAARTEVEP